MLSFEVKYAVQILSELYRAGTEGGRMKITEIKEICGLEARGLTLAMAGLRRHHWVESINNRYYITKDLTKTTLYELIVDIDKSFGMGLHYSAEGWPYKNRHRHKATMALDQKITEEMAAKFKQVFMSELFQLNASLAGKPQRDTLSGKEDNLALNTLALLVKA